MRKRARAPEAKRGVALRRYLVAGVLVWLPIIATVWVVRFIVQIMDQTLLLLPEDFRPEKVLGFPTPGLGLVFAFLVLLVTGLLVTNLVGRRLVTFWEDLLQRIPLVRSIYTGVKGFAETVFSQKSDSFRQVVMIEYPRKGMWSIAFVTSTDVPEVSAKTGEPQVCVYVPTTPNPTSGLIVMVPRREIVALDMSVDAAMKMIVTLGIVVPEGKGAVKPSAVRLPPSAR